MDLSRKSAVMMLVLTFFAGLGWLVHNLSSADPIEHVQGLICFLIATVALASGLILLQLPALVERFLLGLPRPLSAGHSRHGESSMNLSLNSAFAMFTIALLAGLGWLAHNLTSADPIEHIRGLICLLIATVALGSGLILLQFYVLHQRWESEAESPASPASTPATSKT